MNGAIVTFLGTITGSSPINLSTRNDYQKLKNENFLFIPKEIETSWTRTNWTTGADGWNGKEFIYTYAYNNETGILTQTDPYYNGGDGGNFYVYYTCEVYLVV